MQGLLFRRERESDDCEGAVSDIPEWRANALRRGYVPGRHRLMDMVWDLPDFPKFEPWMSADDYRAALDRHRLAIEEYDRKYPPSEP